MDKFEGAHVVYWTSQYAGSASQKGADTPMFQANCLAFDDEDKAWDLMTKLLDLKRDGGTYRGRKVVHVAQLPGLF